jgi:hypothetical protein
MVEDVLKKRRDRSGGKQRRSAAAEVDRFERFERPDLLQLRRDARDEIIRRDLLANGDGEIAVGAAPCAEGNVNIQMLKRQMSNVQYRMTNVEMINSPFLHSTLDIGHSSFVFECKDHPRLLIDEAAQLELRQGCQHLADVLPRSRDERVDVHRL